MYYFRWRTYKSHIHPTNCSAVGGFPPSKDCKNRTDGIDFVVRRPFPTWHYWPCVSAPRPPLLL